MALYITCIFFVEAVLSIYVAVLAVRKHSKEGRCVAWICMFAGIITLCATGTFWLPGGGILLAFEAAMFIAIDLMLASLLTHVVIISRLLSDKATRIIGIVVLALILGDAALMISNVFTGSVIGFSKEIWYDTSVWVFESYPLFVLHMALDYAMVLGTVALLIVSAARTPRIYRARFLNILIAIIFIAALNVAFAYGPLHGPFDVSVLGYVVGSVTIYWSTFRYDDEIQADRVLRLVTEGVEFPIVVFDYRDTIVSCNRAFRENFPKVPEHEATLPEVAEILHFPLEECEGDSGRISWSPTSDLDNLFRCRMEVFRDNRGRLLGTAFVLQDIANDIDAITGLNVDQGYQRELTRLEASDERPIAFLSFNLNQLQSINETYGRVAGDAALEQFAHQLMHALPSDAFIAARAGSDVDVLWPGHTEADAIEVVNDFSEKLTWDLPGGLMPSFEYGISQMDETGVPILPYASRAVANMRMKKMSNQRALRSSVVLTLARALVDRRLVTTQQLDNMSIMATEIATEMKLSEAEIARCRLLAVMQNVGNIAVPDAVLKKPGPFTREERRMQRSHVESGYRIMRASEGLHSLANPLLHHHEYWDGLGYPDGLKGTEIPIEARIISVVDAFNAMTNARTYRSLLSVTDATNEIVRCAGHQFDPSVVEAFVAVVERNGKVLEHTISKIEAPALEPTVVENRARILVVDDVEINRALIMQSLGSENYVFEEAADGAEAMAILDENPEGFDLLTLDLVMPVMDGYHVLGEMSRRGMLESVPVIVVTGAEEVSSIHKAYDLGAAEVIKKPYDARTVQQRVANTIASFSNRRMLAEKIDEQASDIIYKNERLREQANRLVLFNDQIAAVIAAVMEYRDAETAGHVNRVMEHTYVLASEIASNHPSFGLSEDQVEPMAKAAVLHDVGKIAIPDSVLFKKGKLTETEFDVMKSHTICGADLLERALGDSDADFARFAMEIALSHHERWDGAGYPNGLSGNEIPLSAQICALADAYDALTSNRPYKDALPEEVAVQMILDGECGKFSDELLEVFKVVPRHFEGDMRTYNLQHTQIDIKYTPDLDDIDPEQTDRAMLGSIIRVLNERNREQYWNNSRDLMTGTLNQNSYLLYLERLNPSQLTSLGCVYIDVNGLHKYNREYGHDQGNYMLKGIAKAIMDVFAGSNVFRVGGDEFVVFCENRSREYVAERVEMFEKAIAETRYSVSLGMEWRDDKIDMAEIVKSADMLMFENKAHYYEEMRNAGDMRGA